MLTPMPSKSECNMEIKELVRNNIRSLSPYSTARDEYDAGGLGVFLDANENPYDSGVNRYPDPYQKKLKERLSEMKGIEADRIFLGNGSDEPIDLVYRVFCEPRIDNVVSIAPTYGMYRVAAATNDVEVAEVQLEADFSLDTDKLLAATDDNTKVIFLCSPNNPTGNSFPKEQMRDILRRFQGLVVVDEAYIDFSSDAGMLPELAEYPNLIVLQTLSKAWGMAGLRLGLAFADPYIISLFTRVKYPYNINVVTQAMVLERLSAPVDDQVGEIIAQRKVVVEAIGGMPAVKHIYPSDANFILVRFDDPRGVYAKLIGAGVIVRDRSAIRGCEGCLRITIGTPEENQKLIKILGEL